VRNNINRGFRKLRVWNDAVELYVLSCKLLSKFPYELKRTAGNCIDSSHSISRNIAEGYCRKSIVVFPVILWVLLSMVLITSCQNKKDNLKSGLPNIIIIFADDMGYGDVSALNPLGKIHTPAIDRLVNEGISFTEAHSSASVCTPSRYGLLTGRYAFRSEGAAFGVWGFNKPVIEPGRETLASLLKQAGYATACIGKWHLGLDWQTKDGLKPVLNEITGYSNVDYRLPIKNGPNDYGFDYSFIHPASLDIPPYMFLRNHHVIDPDVILTTDHYPARMENTQYSWDKKHTNEHAVYWEKGVWWRQGEMSRSFRIENCHSEIVREGVDFIEKHAEENSGNPFFLYLPLTGPHTPWVPTEQFKGKTPIGLYGDFVLDIDDAVDQIKNVLQKHKIDGNTLLVFTTDNGGYWPQEEIDLHAHDSNHGRRGQKGDVWDGGHRVPLIISWPARIDKPLVCDQLVSLKDFYATFTEMIGHETAEGQSEDSYSFWHIINGDLERPIRPSMVHHSSRGMYSIRTGGWKYIEGLGSGGFTDPAIEIPEPGGAQGQLYHIETDSQEENNLYLKNSGKVEELKELLNSVKNQHQTQNRYLLLDPGIVKATENVSLELGEVIKDSGNPLFGEEYWADPPKKWEARFDNLYPNVIFDDEDKLFKIWYKSFVRYASSESVPV
jgi:arylsulfatase A